MAGFARLAPLRARRASPGQSRSGRRAVARTAHLASTLAVLAL